MDICLCSAHFLSVSKHEKGANAGPLPMSSWLKHAQTLQVCSGMLVCESVSGKTTHLIMETELCP